MIQATVDLTPLYGAANELIATVATGLAIVAAGWVRWAFHNWLTPYIGAQLEAKASDDLNTALENGVRAALNDLQAWEVVHKDADVRGAVTAWAAQYAVNHAPAAIARFGLSPDALAIKALSFIPAPPASTIGVTGNTINTDKVTVNNLAPVGEKS